MDNAPEVSISIDGSALYNGQQCAVGGWGAVIYVNGAVAEACASLCPNCDPGPQTNNRAELRAVEWALGFVHELAKLGHPLASCARRISRRAPRNALVERHAGSMNDSRPVDGHLLNVVIRTDSEYVVNGWRGVNRRVAHLDLWRQVSIIARCMTRNGMSLSFEHVRAHAGDWPNERADELAREVVMGVDRLGEHTTMDACCITCEEDFGGDHIELARHIKEEHMLRDLEAETTCVTVFADSDGVWRCNFCQRAFRSRFALLQHVEDKHARGRE